MNPAQYIKNVGKSMGYIAIDTFKAMNPAVAEFYSNAKELSTDLYQTIDDFKGKAVSNNPDSIKSKFKSTAVETWKNARDDFLSGNWYNKERKNAATDEMMKAMGFDLDLDFDIDDFGDDSWGDENSSSKKSVVEAELESDKENTREVVGAINGSVASAANTIASATAKSTEYMVAIQNQNTAELYDLSAKGFNNVGLGLNAINANLSSILSLAEPLTAHMQNSATYFTKSTELQTETVTLLRKLVNHVVPEKTGAKRSKSMDDYIGDGGINFAAMFSDLKESISSTVKEFKEMSDMFGGSSTLSNNVKASPISSLLTKLIPLLIPRDTKQNIKWFNESLKSLGYHGYSKLANKAEDSLLGGILSFFGFDLPRNTSPGKYNTKNYEKGKVDWDGTSRKALMEVIPYYLSKMTAIMEGTNEMEVFDYDSGKFVTKRALLEDFNKKQKDTASLYSYEFYDRIKKNKSGHEIHKTDLEELNLLLALNGGNRLYDLIDVDSKVRDRFINSHKEIKAFFDKHPEIRTVIETAANTIDKNDFNKFDLETVLMETGDLRSNLKDNLRRAEESGQYNMAFNGGRDFKSGLFGGVDENGKAPIDYLRGIYINTMRLSTKGKGKKGGALYDPLGIKLSGSAPSTTKSAPDVSQSSTATATAANKAEYSYEEYLSEKLKFKPKTIDEINKSSKYTELMKERYEKSLAGDEWDTNDPTYKEILKLNAKYTATGKLKEISDDLGLKDTVKGFLEQVTKCISQPVEIFNTLVVSFRSALHDIIFSEKGLFGWLFDKERGVLRKPIGKILGFVDNRVGTDFASWLGFDQPAIGNAYNGRVIRRTGLAAVSEGEVIIPAEFNPYYTKAINKEKQRMAENYAIDRFFGSFDSGGIVGESGTGKKKRGRNKQSEEPRNNTVLGAGERFLKKGFTDFGNMLYETFSDIIGTKVKGQKEKVAGIITDAVNEIKPHAGDAILGGMVGGGISLLTGAVVSPILGASLGAATGLIMSSEKVRDFLFGKIDNKGNRTGGLFGDTGAKIRQFMEDQLPDTLLGGALGGAGGALFGHPVLGMFIGSGLGFVSKSRGVQDFLFGEVDKKTKERKGGLISKEMQDWIKKIAPGMGAGAIAGLVGSAFGGPFGLVGNMLVGSVIGGIASTDTFKDFFFGKKDENGKRQGGLIQIVRDNVLDPARESFFNLTERIRDDFRSLAVGFFDKLKDVAKWLSETGIVDTIKTAFKGAGDWVMNLKPVQFLTPYLKDFASFRNINERIKVGNIARGLNTRDKNGKLLSAQERLDFINDSKYRFTKGGKDRTDTQGYKTAELLAGMKSKKQLKDFNQFINQMYDADESQRAEMLANSEYSGMLKTGSGDLSKSSLRKMRDAVKAEGNARFNSPIIKAIDSSETVTAINNDIKSILNYIRGDVDKSNTIDKKFIQEKKEKEERDISLWKLAEKQNSDNEKRNEKLEEITGDDPNALNDRESRKGGLLNKLFGEDSVIGQAADFIKKIGTVVGVAGIGMLIASTTGIFDKLMTWIPGMGGSQGSTNSYSTKEGDTINFNWGEGFTTVGADGTTSPVTDPDDINNNRTDSYSWSERAKEALARLGIGTTLTIPVAVLTQGTKLLEMALKTLGSCLKKIPLLKGQAKLIDNFMAMLGHEGEMALRKVPEATAKSICTTLQDALAVITIAMVIIDFTSGMQDAEVTFKVSNPTFAERIISGYIRALKNLIPVIGVLIPDTVIVDIAVKCFGDALGMDKLQQQRNEAEAELAQYNDANGTDLTWAQYQKGVLNNKTWTEEAWEGAKSKAGAAFVGAQQFIKNPGEYIGSAFKTAADSFNNTSGGVVSKGMAFNASLVDELLPGIIGDVLNSGYKVFQKAFEGDVSGMQSINVAAFEGDERGITSFVSHLFNPVLAVSKLMAYPIAFGVKFLKDLWESMTGANAAMDSMNKDIFTAHAMVQGKALVGDLPGMWELNVEGNTGIGVIDKLQSILLTTVKVLDTPWAAVGFAAKTVVGFFDKQIKGIKKGYDYLDKQKDIAKELLESNEENHSKVYQIDKPGDDVSMGGLFYAGAYVTRTFTIATELVKGVGRTLMSMFKDSSFYKTHAAMSQNNLEAAKLAFAADPIGLWQLQDSNTETGFWSFLSKGSLILNKVMNTPWAVTSRLVVSLVEGLVEQGKKGIDTFGTIKTDSEALAGYAFSGDFENLFSYESTANPNGDSPFWGGLGSLAIGAERMVLAIPAGISWIGGKLGKKVGKIVDDVKTAADFFKDNIDKGTDIATASALTTGSFVNWTALTSGLPSEDGSIMTGIFNGMTILTRLIGVVPAAIKLGGAEIKAAFDTYKTAFTNNSNTYDSAMTDLTTVFNDDSQTFQNVWDVNMAPLDGLDPLADFRFAGFSISKLLLTGVKFIKGFFKSVIEEIDFTSIWQGIKDIANFKKDEGGSGSGIGAGSSFISQADPRFAGKSIGGSTVGAMGCGPAAASMVLGNSMGANINLARRYQTFGGTDLSYFGDVFSRNGKRPIYYNLSGGASGQDMISDIAAGKSVVLMGRDPYNTSKAYSPFGPGNHYVVARGFKNGGIVIDDPESSRGGRVYSPSILRSVTAAVGAGSSGLRGRMVGIGGGGAMTSNANAQAIWAFFKQQGYADGAIAGILANVQAESSFNTRASGDGGTSYGICQWHLGRKTKLQNFAASSGGSVDDINIQVAYLKSELDAGAAGGGYASITDPEKAAEQFCRQFERPRYPDRDSAIRKPIAVEFYNAFSGKTFSASVSSSTGSTSSASANLTPYTSNGANASKPWAGKTGAAKFFSAASNIGSIFTSAFSSVFSGNNGDTGSFDANQFKPASGNNTQVTQWAGKQPVQYMSDMLGKLRYSNTQRDPDQGSGDCTSTVQWAIRKAGGPDISTHTGWQYANKNNWQKVLWYNNGQMLGNNPIPVNVQPNDLIYYRSKSNLDESVYPDSIGHVEMVLNGNTLIGNGSDPGTKVKDINWNKDRILKIVRVNNAPWGGSGSGLDLSDLKPRGLKSSGAGRSGNIYSFSDYKSSRNATSGSDRNMFLILRAMLTFVEALVDNTKDIKSIYTLLTKYCAGSLNKAEAAQALSEMSSSDTSKIEDGLASLKSTIDSILAS